MERKALIRMRVSRTGTLTQAAYKRVAATRPPRAIHTQRDYRYWKGVLLSLMAEAEAKMTSAQAAYAETVALLIEAYEKRHHPLARVSPSDVLAELMAAHNLKQKELVDIFGSEAAVSYALHGKRNLTVEQIRGLAAKFRVSPGLFI
jgi:HTH-type transcriptional regulator/antitoxin HigA